MGNTYAEIENGIVTNAVVCDDSEFALSQGWIELPDGYGIGASFDGEKWIKSVITEVPTPIPPQPSKAELLAKLIELQKQIEAIQ